MEKTSPFHFCFGACFGFSLRKIILRLGKVRTRKCPSHDALASWSPREVLTVLISAAFKGRRLHATLPPHSTHGCACVHAHTPKQCTLTTCADPGPRCPCLLLQGRLGDTYSSLRFWPESGTKGPGASARGGPGPVGAILAALHLRHLRGHLCDRRPETVSYLSEANAPQ